MATSELSKLRAGQAADAGPLSARVWNRLVEIGQAVVGMRGGPGIKVQVKSSGIVISADPDAAMEIPGVITAASGTAAGPATFTYDVTPIGRPDIDPLPGKAPDEGRPVDPADNVWIYPARAGDRCTILLIPDPGGSGSRMTKLRVYTERIAFGPCGT